jgi:Neutral/alkaline non-lysosomal ceramidase, C-terminal
LGKKQLSLIAPVVVDTIGIGRKFGSVAVDAKDQYFRGVDTVHVSFRSANPRNNQRIEDSFLKVDRRLEDGSWKTLYVDGDWSTKYVWKSDVDALGVSFAEIYWTIPGDAEQGTYRICHFGTRKTWIGDLEWLTYHTPDWWSFDMFGSLAAGFFFQCIRLLASISESFNLVLSEWTIGWYKDFHGCSRVFLVSST